MVAVQVNDYVATEITLEKAYSTGEVICIAEKGAFIRKDGDGPGSRDIFFHTDSCRGTPTVHCRVRFVEAPGKKPGDRSAKEVQVIEAAPTTGPLSAAEVIVFIRDNFQKRAHGAAAAAAAAAAADADADELSPSAASDRTVKLLTNLASVSRTVWPAVLNHTFQLPAQCELIQSIVVALGDPEVSRCVLTTARSAVFDVFLSTYFLQCVQLLLPLLLRLASCYDCAVLGQLLPDELNHALIDSC